MSELNVKDVYIKPESEIVDLDLEQPVLTGSGDDFGHGGWWG